MLEIKKAVFKNSDNWKPVYHRERRARHRQNSSKRRVIMRWRIFANRSERSFLLIFFIGLFRTPLEWLYNT